MNDPGGLRFRQRIGDLDGVLQNLVQLQPAARNQLASVLPWTYSMTMKSVPLSLAMSWMVMMLG